MWQQQASKLNNCIFKSSHWSACSYVTGRHPPTYLSRQRLSLPHAMRAPIYVVRTDYCSFSMRDVSVLLSKEMRGAAEIGFEWSRPCSRPQNRKLPVFLVLFVCLIVFNVPACAQLQRCQHWSDTCPYGFRLLRIFAGSLKLSPWTQSAVVGNNSRRLAEQATTFLVMTLYSPTPSSGCMLTRTCLNKSGYKHFWQHLFVLHVLIFPHSSSLLYEKNAQM